MNPPASEVLRVLHIDGEGRLARVTEHSSDSPHHIDVPLRRIVADALAVDARSWVVSHNHPGGDPRPSRADILATRALARVGAALGIRIHDHVVEAGERHFSFRDAGLL